MDNSNPNSRKNIAWYVPLALLVAWELLARASILPPSQSAPPSLILYRLGVLIASGTILWHSLLSVLRLVAGVSIGTFVGVSSGLLLAENRKIDRLFSPMLQYLAPIPAIVWFPFLIMIFGVGVAWKIALVAISVFFLLHIHTFQAIRSIKPDYIELSAIYEKSQIEKLRHIFLPFASLSVFIALRIGLAIGWIVLFVAEYADSAQGSGGLGWFIADARALRRIEDEFAGVLLLGTIGFVIDRFVAKIQKRTLKWRKSYESQLITIEGVR